MPVLASPPLLEGDSLTSDEFLRRWEAMPDLKRAELIEGTVYMPFAVGIDHGRFHSLFGMWLGNYAAGTPGCMPSLEATCLMAGKRESKACIIPKPPN